MNSEEVSGARPSDQALVNEAPTGLRPTGFDPSRVARKLTAEQADEILRHTACFSPPYNARRARALWHGIKPKGERPLFLLQKEHGVTRYRLSAYGAAVKEALRGSSDGLPEDVIRLVIAAREVAFGPIADSVRHEPEFREVIKELDAASEAFAARVPWDDEPCDSDGPRMAETPAEAARGEAGPARAAEGGIAQGVDP